ncbi:Auxin-induced protein 5NG4 [Hordeum vulgare]|nr:Auxin-induced protein 5NG4 [Hordeum vulgare]
MHLCRPFSSSPKPRALSKPGEDAVPRPTLQLPPTVTRRRYPDGVIVETTLRVWAFSRWMGGNKFAQWFLGAGFAHLLADSPVMFRLEEVRPNATTTEIRVIANLTNIFDAYYLLGKVFWCGCEFIAFTTYNIFTDFDSIFPTRNGIHSFAYYIGEDDMVEEH